MEPTLLDNVGPERLSFKMGPLHHPSTKHSGSKKTRSIITNQGTRTEITQDPAKLEPNHNHSPSYLEILTNHARPANHPKQHIHTINPKTHDHPYSTKEGRV